MFSGIIESMGEVISSEKAGTNVRFHISCPFLSELKVDQSVSHNGVCLTVTKINEQGYFVDVISESLDKSNLGNLKPGQKINLERSVRLNDRLDGHLVQGHVDQTARLTDIKNLNGSWTFSFTFNNNAKHVLIDKGSISVNGVSLTISALLENGFQVSIIPYTYEHTNFGSLALGDDVNIEFDVIGKYVERLNSI
jgi:riboflavin synthase